MKIGEWFLESALNQMTNGERTVYLGALKTKLLEYLATKAGAVVERNALIEDVWGGFASDHTITQHIALLRKYLGSNKDQVYIQTVPKKGYRLIAPVSWSSEYSAERVFAGMDLANIRVIVIDDSDFINDYLACVLGEIGLKKITIFSNVEEAVAALNSQSFDLVITDVVMEPVNGLELIKQIRTGDTGLDPFTAAIVMTSYAETDVLGSAILLDVNGFLTKPFSTEKVHEKVVHALTEAFQYRPAIAYRHIDVSFVVDIEASETRKSRDSRCAAGSGLKGGAHRVKFNDLKEGMVLAESLRAVDGSLILPQGTELSRTNIFRLREIALAVLSVSDVAVKVER